MLVIYHGNCPDGLASALVFYQADQKTEFWAADHGSEPPLSRATGKDVLLVDFVYKLGGMKQLQAVAKSIRALDHHKSTEPLMTENLGIELDMHRSGCQMAWDFVHPNEPRPYWIDDIADRDLWIWTRPGSKEVTRAFFGLGAYQSIDSLDQAVRLYTPERRHELVEIGKIFCESDQISFKLIAKRAKLRNLHCPDGTVYKVAFLLCDAHQVSDVGDMLCSEVDLFGQPKYDFAVMVRFDFERRCFVGSLRASGASSIDLTRIASQFGQGGGHAKAAGCNFGDQQQLYNAIRSTEAPATNADDYADALIRAYRASVWPGYDQSISGPDWVNEAFAKRLRQRFDDANIPCEVQLRDFNTCSVELGAKCSVDDHEMLRWEPLMLAKNIRA